MLALRGRVATLAVAAAALVATLAPGAAAQHTPPPPGVIEGIVVRQANTPTTPPAPVAGATVKVFMAPATTPNPTPVREGVSDDHGRFRFEGLAAGAYLVRASKEGVGIGSAGAQLTTTAGARVHIVLVPPPPPPGPAPGVLEGLVVRGSNTPTPQPTPVAGATVRVFPHVSTTPRPDPVREGTTDDHGRFHFEGLRAGAYVVVAFKDGVGEGRASAMLTELHGARVTVVLVPPPPPPPPPGVLEGTVFAATTAGPVPVPDAEVMVFRVPMTTPHQPPVRVGTTDVHGNFRFEGLRPGRYHAVAQREGLGRGHAYALLTEAFGARVRILLRTR
ncbi:MAG: carboxypeptidase regulatory-like domain-containing protein [Phycisphaerae bacterium]|nr:carboxypeptidase regulatory-like domain-containing protein [Phycisphaerae bacterium]